MATQPLEDLDTAYKTLDLHPGASVEDIKKAYRNLAKAWHPDHFLRHPQLQKQCEKKMRRINWAYEYLANSICEAPKPFTARSVPPSETEPAKPENPSWTTTSDPARPYQRRPSRFKTSVDLSTEFFEESADASSFSLRMQTAKNEEINLPRLGAAFFASIVLMGSFFATQGPTHPIYYEILRLMVFASSLYGAHCAALKKFWDFAFVLISIAIVLNPLFPIRFTLLEWWMLNTITPCFFIYVWLKLCEEGVGESRANYDWA